MTERTSQLLANELKAAGLHEMARKAEADYYHDFKSPLDLPELQLESDLRTVGTPAAMALRKRVINGDFDADLAESEAWANSDDGKATFDRLVREIKKDL